MGVMEFRVDMAVKRQMLMVNDILNDILCERRLLLFTISRIKV